VSAWYTGAITITPPLSWAEIRNGPRLRDVRLRITETSADTDTGRTTTATADAVLPLEDGDCVGGDVAEDIQAIVDHYGRLGHEFAGHIQCDYPTGMVGPDEPNRERYVVAGGRVQTVTPRLVWPGEDDGLLANARALAKALMAAIEWTPGIAEDRNYLLAHEWLPDWFTGEDNGRAMWESDDEDSEES